MPTSLPFVGRNDELRLLHATWRNTQTYNTPHVVVLVAETGVGKSRIIKEFYRELIREHGINDDAFWPDSFTSDEKWVNPEFPEHHKPQKPPKFLWLGTAWDNPGKQRDNDTTLINLKQQLEKITQHISKVIPANLLGAMKDDFVHIAKSLVTEQLENVVVDVVIGSFVPHYQLLKKAFLEAKETQKVLGFNDSTTTLDEELLMLFTKWFSHRPYIPLILWLDDVHWINKESVLFFSKLMHNAQQKGWPVLCIATCWPKEWNEFADDCFLKQHPCTVCIIDSASNSELEHLVRATFPYLPAAQMQLLVRIADNNYLTMIENITQLLTKPRLYLLPINGNYILSDEGISRIQKWEENSRDWVGERRQAHINSRFSEFDEEIQDFLARASRSGIDSKFMHSTLVRCSTVIPHIGLVTELIQRCCQIGAVTQLSGNLFEFRDRGYYTVARNHFAELLEKTESVKIHTTFVDELNAQIDTAYNSNGELVDRLLHPNAFQSAPINEQSYILHSALQLNSTDSPTYVRAIGIYILQCATNNTWSRIRTLVIGETDAETVPSTYRSIDWAHHAGKTIGWNTIVKLAEALVAAGVINDAEYLYRLNLQHCEDQHTTFHSHQTQHELAIGLYAMGTVSEERGDYTTALTCHNQALLIRQQLYTQTHEINHLRESAIIRIHIGRIHQATGALNDAQSYFHAAYTIASQLATTENTYGDRDILSAILNYIGHIYRITNDFDNALRCFYESLAHARTLVQEHSTVNGLRRLSIALHNIGRIHQIRAHLSDAITYFEESLKIKRQIVQVRGTSDDTKSLSVTLNEMGILHRNTKDYQKALMFFMESREFYTQLVNIRNKPQDRFELSFTLEQTALTYQANNQITEALKCFIESLTICHQLITERGIPADFKRISLANYYIAKLYLGEKQTRPARRHFKHALRYAKKAHMTDSQIISSTYTTEIQQHIDDLSINKTR